MAATHQLQELPRGAEVPHDADAVVYGILVMPITNEAGRHIAGEHALTRHAPKYRRARCSPRVWMRSMPVFDEILRDLRTQYLIGYYPKNVPLTKNHFIRLRNTHVSQPGFAGGFPHWLLW